MPEIVCPECGLIVGYDAMRRAADEFCPQCDYPLFWAPSSIPVAVATTRSDATLRRLPGAGGRRMLGSKVCQSCGEHNTLAAMTCIRCGSDLDVKEPEPEPEPEPVVLDVPPPPAPPKKRRPWWPWAVAAGIVVLVVVLILVL